MIFEPFSPFVPSGFQIKFAVDPWEKAAACALRRQVFCEEQGVFSGDDRDETDDVAIPIVAVSLVGVAADTVVGTVRIHQAEPGLWWGSRLAVGAEYRRIGALGSGLIRLAVSSAHARGCTRFLANVQSRNALLFRRLHWTTVETFDLYGRPHHRMEADLSYYPPFATPEEGFLSLARKAA
ncbi:putative N-acetyltransferase (TIGR04045 family) [Skermanella aerolata]|uniref:MSMEG_0567/Sll0786 family nitrogen starvation N-acetyltransferase n=1 Tax=Skermanella aerolata TaxID=393310 RepID=UPI003D2583D1